MASILFAGYFLALVSIFSPSVQAHFTLPKLLVFRLGATVFLGWALWATLRGLSRPLPPIAAVTALLTVWWTLSTMLATHFDTAVNGYYGRYNGLSNHLLYVAVFLALASLPLSAEHVEKITQLFVVALLPASLYAVLQALHRDPLPWHSIEPGIRPASSIGHPVLLAATLALAIPFAVVFTATSRAATRRWAWGTALLLLALASALTLSRGPWLGAICAVVIIAWALQREKVLRPARLLAAGALVLSLSGAWVLSAPAAREALFQRLRAVAAPAADPSLAWRLRLYGVAIRMIADSPVVGTGFETFHNLYPLYKPPQPSDLDVVPTMVHNGYLQLAQESGLPGLALYVLTLFLIFRRLVRTCRRASEPRRRLLAAAFLASVAGFAVQDLSGWPEVSLTSLFWLLAGLSIAATNVAATDDETSSRASPTRAQRARAFAFAACTAASLFLTLDAAARFRADAQYRRALLTDPTKSWQDRQALLLRASELLPSEARYAEEAAHGYYDRLIATGDREAYDKGVAMLLKARTANPYEYTILLGAVQFDCAALRLGLIERPSALGAVAASSLPRATRDDRRVSQALANLRYLTLVAGRRSGAGLPVSRTFSISAKLKTGGPMQVDRRAVSGDP